MDQMPENMSEWLALGLWTLVASSWALLSASSSSLLGCTRGERLVASSFLFFALDPHKACRLKRRCPPFLWIFMRRAGLSLWKLTLQYI